MSKNKNFQNQNESAVDQEVTVEVVPEENTSETHVDEPKHTIFGKIDESIMKKREEKALKKAAKKEAKEAKKADKESDGETLGEKAKNVGKKVAVVAGSGLILAAGVLLGQALQIDTTVESDGDQCCGECENCSCSQESVEAPADAAPVTENSEAQET